MFEIIFVVTLEVISASPIYILMSSLTALVTIALYASSSVTYSPFRGQLSLSQQLIT